MQRIRAAFQKHQNILSSNLGQILFLFLISLIAHGIFIPWLGIYGDDWTLVWLSYRTGTTASFFPANRFLFPYIYSLFSFFLDPVIREWHILFFLIRFLSVVNLWILLRKLWPNKKQVWAWISLLFALYPGSLIIYQPITFWTVYLQFSFLFISFWTMLDAVKNNKKRWILLFISVCFAILNLVLEEYLYFLELLRIPILLAYLANSKFDLHGKNKKIFWISIPFLMVFLAASIERMNFHSTATTYYNVDLGNYLSRPIDSIKYFSTHIFFDGIRSGYSAWFKPLFGSELFFYSGSKSILLLGSIACCTALFIFFFSEKVFKNDEERYVSITSILLGVIGLICAGVPFWLANLPIEIGPANYSRFSIPAAFGSAFLIYGTATLLFRKRVLSNIILCVFCGSAVMLHLLSGNFFRKEWELQNRFFWQLAWRIPAVDPGTTFFSNELPFWTIGENSVSAALNWIYMENNPPIELIDYYFYYDEKRFVNEFPQEKDTPFTSGHLVGVFSGNSSNVITFWYQPSACLYVINNAWDRYNPDIPPNLRALAEKYPNDLIHPQGTSETILRNDPLFSDEDRDSFCYFFQKANLAADNKNWDEVVDMWTTSLSENKKPSTASELLPFIQGLAHKNQYEDAFKLSLEILEISKGYDPLVCEFWSEIKQDESLDEEKINGFIESELTCNY